MSSENEPKIGLRERKKLKTKATIQQHALRLFQEQGYYATTVEQIAEVSEVSPSTFFRYFPTKEAVVLDDDYDPLLIKVFRSLPADLSPIQAFRATVRSALFELSEDERKFVQERVDLAVTVPELRAALFNQMMSTMGMITEIVAERANRDKNDFHVVSFAGAVMGAVMSVQMYCSSHPGQDFLSLVDNALAHLEAGLPL